MCGLDTPSLLFRISIIYIDKSLKPINSIEAADTYMDRIVFKNKMTVHFLTVKKKKEKLK